jgi:hypothetical protein
MRLRIALLGVGLCFWLIITRPPVAHSQGAPQSGSVRVNKGEQIDFRLRYLRPTGGGDPRASTETPSGRASVTRDDDSTSIHIRLEGFPRNPGRYYLYLVQDDNSARQIAQFEKWIETTDNEPSDLESFRLAVSTEPGLSTIEPGRDDVIMVSVAPGH